MSKKIAIFSDIHSNSYAFKSCLDDALRQGIEKFINLGDLFYGPIAPQETYEIVKKYDFVSMLGNQDRQILEATSQDLEQNLTLRYVLEDLSDEALKWLESLPFDIKTDKDIYACHGSPKSDTTYLLEKIENNSLHVRSDDEILDELKDVTSPLILCGHSHLAKCVLLSNGQMVINVGSVGLPAYKDDEPLPHKVEIFSSHATYVLLEKTDNKWNVDFKKMDYDIKSALNCAKKRKEKIG